MAMSVGEGGADAAPMMDINMTPLIDVLLVLLVMFIITIPVMTHAVKLDMPRPTNAPQQQADPVVIQLEIDFDGTVLWNGTPVTVDSLDTYFRREAANDPQPELHIRPNKRASYDVVARVLAAAQRNGLLKIGFVGNEQFM
ncbi:MAG TPA: biopolymer transporter ExbD [Steroidobacteraceae bacterium]|jgi:biopolymer transport protein ExbD|nr:biopolymer transporter ExbD [Steroidobacteraceae bacterium]